tara:strand:+ start:38 stop:211 length:174 start_codon:yes stop_codon:yes gene_type:complete
MNNKELALAIEAAHNVTKGYGSGHPTYSLFSGHSKILLLEQQRRASLTPLPNLEKSE